MMFWIEIASWLIIGFAVGYWFVEIIASLKRIYASYKARQELPPPGSSMGE